MHTNNIILEEVTAAAFDEMKKYWNLTEFNTRDDSLQAKILNPLMWPILSDRTETYQQFLEFLLDDRWLDEISVNEEGCWIKRYARKMNHEDVKSFARIAANSPLERNYFDVKFKDPQTYGRVERVMMEFREYTFNSEDVRIVGYQTTVPREYTHLFNAFLQKENFFKVQGLWVPDEGKKVTVNATR